MIEIAIAYASYRLKSECGEDFEALSEIMPARPRDLV
jgi:hypothetical protein